MDTDSGWQAQLLGSWAEQLRNGAEHLPGIIGAVLVFTLGWMLARLTRRTVRALATAANRFLSRKLPAGPMAVVRVSPLMTTLLGEILFWTVVVVAATLALRIAGFDMIAPWLDRVTVYLPNLVAALVILVAGFLLSIFVREQLSPPDAATADAARRAWIARVSQGLVIAVAVIVGLDQLGINVALLVALVVVAIAGVTLALGATFALGARRYLANLIGVQSARTQLSVGQWLRIDDFEGRIIEISATQIVLDAEQGKILLPGHFLDDRPATILYRDADGESHDG